MRKPLTESQIQRAFIEWCRWNEARYPALRLGHAIPNGAKRNIVVATILKREGVRAGMPDWSLPVARGGYAGLWVEFKLPGGKPSVPQKSVISLLRMHHHRVEICYSTEEAIRMVKEYLA